MYLISEMDCFDANYQKKLLFNFSETQNTRKQTTKATCASCLIYGFLVLFPERSKFRTAELPGFCSILAK
jgi:hypothetical protein